MIWTACFKSVRTDQFWKMAFVIGAVLTVQFKQKLNGLKQMNISNKGRSVSLFDLNGQNCSDQDNFFVQDDLFGTFFRRSNPYCLSLSNMLIQMRSNVGTIHPYGSFKNYKGVSGTKK